MKCRQCGFENMPGLDRCFKCGSVLTTVGEPIEIEPPRMKWWKKPGRDLMRLGRQSGLIRPIPVPQWAKQVVDDEYIGIYISIVPGLGHLVKRRFGQAWWLVALWLLLILAAIFFFGISAGMFFTGMAVVVHAWLAISCSYMEVQKDILRRLMAIVLVCGALGILYTVIWRFSTRDYPNAFAAMDFPGQKVNKGDLLIGRRIDGDANTVHSGDLVLARIGYVTRRGQWFGNDGQQRAIAQVIGRGNDIIAINNGCYHINGTAMDPNYYPLPEWLQKFDISISIEPGKYFLSTAFTARIQTDPGYFAEYVRRACVRDINEITGKVFLRWLPLSRRGFIKGLE